MYKSTFLTIYHFVNLEEEKSEFHTGIRRIEYGYFFKVL